VETIAGLHQAVSGMDQMERLSLADSPVHSLHPMPKCMVTLVYIVVVVSFPPQDLSGLVPFLFYPAVLAPLSGTPYRLLLKRLLLALPFSLLAGLSNLVLLRGAAFSAGGLTVSLGMVSFVSILLKTALTVFAALLLLATTPLAAVSGQLAAWHVPKVLCLSLVMTYRYVSVLLGEASTMYTAYALRAPGGKGILMRHMGSFLGQLILRSFDRAERVHQAMKCRGFQGVYTGQRPDAMRPRDWAYAAALPIALAALRFFNVSLFLGRLAGSI
jgi:cobalt/nickel transport system permease protein